MSPSTAAAGLIRSYLDDIRATTGAEEVVFWRSDEFGDDMRPAWWSTAHGDDPRHFAEQVWQSLVRWSIQESRPQSDANDPVRLVVAPIASGGSTLGALSVSSEAALDGARETLKDDLARYAARLAALHELLDTREDYHRATQQSTALLAAAQRFTVNRNIDALGDSICTAALEMTAASSAFVVHWSREAEVGEVVYATPDGRVEAGAELSSDCQVAQACAADIPVVMEDARRLGSDAKLFRTDEHRVPIGSLAIIPMRGAVGVIGAIVIEGENPRDVHRQDAKNLRLLALLAGASLETVWEFEEITRRARTDPLTGLFNRGHFDDRLTQMVAETSRFGGKSSLVLFDIDHFKQVNDRYGHPAGDAVLKAIAQLLQRRIRAVDTCARFGGEELALLLPRTEPDGAGELAERLRLAVMEHETVWEGNRISVTISAGVASCSASTDSRESVLAAADQALYRAKSQGRNRVVLASLTA